MIQSIKGIVLKIYWNLLSISAFLALGFVFLIGILFILINHYFFSKDEDK